MRKLSTWVTWKKRNKPEMRKSVIDLYWGIIGSIIPALKNLGFYHRCVEFDIDYPLRKQVIELLPKEYSEAVYYVSYDRDTELKRIEIFYKK
jgi:hypothetical protein